MKKMDSYGLKMCAFQATLFEKSLSDQDCSSKIFIRRFMHSDLATRMDSDGFYFDAIGVADSFNELDMQYGATDYGQQKFSAEEMHWIGYIYRYWAYTYEKSSKQLYKYIKPERLRDLYFPYHSLDPAQAIERILEADGMDTDSQIARGVEILRRVRSTRKRAGARKSIM